MYDKEIDNGLLKWSHANLFHGLKRILWKRQSFPVLAFNCIPDLSQLNIWSGFSNKSRSVIIFFKRLKCYAMTFTLAMRLLPLLSLSGFLRVISFWRRFLNFAHQVWPGPVTELKLYYFCALISTMQRP